MCVAEPQSRVYLHDSSFFASRWQTINDALTYLLERVPEFRQDPAGLARIEGQIAFAHAALGQRALGGEVGAAVAAQVAPGPAELRRAGGGQPAWSAPTGCWPPPAGSVAGSERMADRAGRAGCSRPRRPGAAGLAGVRCCSPASRSGGCSGLGAFAVALIAIPMFVLLVQRRQRRGAAGVLAVDRLRGLGLRGRAGAVPGSRLVGFSVRMGNYLGSSIVFLYIYNGRDRLTNRTVLRALVLFFAFVVAGGYLGVLVPRGSLSTPVQVAAAAQHPQQRVRARPGAPVLRRGAAALRLAAHLLPSERAVPLHQQLGMQRRAAGAAGGGGDPDVPAAGLAAGHGRRCWRRPACRRSPP